MPAEGGVARLRLHMRPPSRVRFSRTVSSSHHLHANGNGDIYVLNLNTGVARRTYDDARDQLDAGRATDSGCTSPPSAETLPE